jgi:hypothetical protein
MKTLYFGFVRNTFFGAGIGRPYDEKKGEGGGGGGVTTRRRARSHCFLKEEGGWCGSVDE